MIKLKPICALVLGLAGVTVLAVRAQEGGSSGTVVLDEGCVWRCYFHIGAARYSAARIKADGEKCLGAKGVEHLKQETESRLKSEGRTASDWTTEAILVFPWRCNGTSADVTPYLKSPPPSGDWMNPGFDDGEWASLRYPFLVGHRIDSRVYASADGNLSVQTACFRTIFQVPDPAQARGLSLSLVCRGGARVFLNGKEIGRCNLPQGDLPSTAPAEDYPPEAYRMLETELPPNAKPDSRRLVGDLPFRFEDGGEIKGTADVRVFRVPGQSSATLSRAAFERILKLRNRTLGPVAIPAELLRKGANVLAVEVHAAQIHPLAANWGGFENFDSWFHGALLELKLCAESGVQTVSARPAGVRVWVEDVNHRVYSPEYRTDSGQTARIAGTLNGVFAAQLVVGADRELTGLKATVTALQAGGGKDVIPATSVQVFYPVPHAASELSQLGENRGRWHDDPFCDQTEIILARYAPQLGSASGKNGEAYRKAAVAALNGIYFFDHLRATPPEKVPANSSQPCWLSLKIPAEAAAGLYRGSVKVEAAGVAPLEVPLEVEVAGWRLPNPADFQTFMGFEESPYGVAQKYGVELWSEKHFELLDGVFRWLGTTGNNWLNIPVLAYTEFGNKEDTPIRWTHKKDGGWAFDYTRLDRYLAVAGKYTGTPLVINFVVNHPGHPGDNRFKNAPVEVPVFDENTGKQAILNIGHDMPEAERRGLWQAFATSLYAHMQAKGLEKYMYWGHPWDGEVDPNLPALLATFCPTVKWTRGGHGHNPDKTFTAVSTIYGSQIWADIKSRQGWNRQEIHLYNPRHAGTVITCFGNATPFAFRLMMERILTGGGRGPGRIGVDYWGPVFLNGFKGRPWLVGMPCNFMLWPGPDGPEGSIRLEIMREGTQEGEARIFLEQALPKLHAAGQKELAARIVSLLDARIQETLFASPGTSLLQMYEYCSGWQSRSRQIFQLAAEAAEKIGVDCPIAPLAADIPARVKTQLPLKLRNWTGAPRAWKAAASDPWIKLGQTEGVLSGQETLPVTLDAAGLEAGKELAGKITVTDAATGRADTVEIKAKVSKVFKLIAAQTALSLTPGKPEKQELTLINCSGAELSWTAADSAAWVSVTPAAGKLAPGGQCSLAASVAPADKDRIRLETQLTLSEAGGKTETVPLVVHVVPEYQPPPGRPAGKEVALQSIPKGKVKLLAQRGYNFFVPQSDRPDLKLQIGREGKVFAAGLVCGQPLEAVYNVDGMNFTAFAAEVGLATSVSKPQNIHLAKLQLHFEIYVDGQLRAQSGLMSIADPPRLLVVTGLENAKELRLKARLSNDEPLGPQWPQSAPTIGCWGDPVFYQK